MKRIQKPSFTKNYIFLPLVTFATAAAITFPCKAAAQASFTVSGESLTLTLSTPIVFVTTAAGSTGESGMGSGLGLVINGAFSTPPPVDFVTATASGSMTLTLGSQTFGLPNTQYFGGGYANTTVGDLDPGDYAFGFGNSDAGMSFSVGSIVTLSAGTYTLTGTTVPVLPNFTATTIDLVGDVGLAPVFATSAITQVAPEPSSWAMLGVGAGSLLFAMLRRSRQVTT